MNAKELLLRCYARKDGDIWIAVCLDFSLAVQGDSLREVQQKLEQQTYHYLVDALEGDDRAHAAYLLRRRAGLGDYLKWYFYRYTQRMDHPGGTAVAFFASIPLRPRPPDPA